MKFLQKILFVTMVTLFVGNADVRGLQPPAPPVAAAVVGANVLDFDTIATIAAEPLAATVIPLSLQPKIYEPVGYNVAGPNNLRYVYFNVLTPTGGAIPGNGAFQHATVLAATADHHLAGGFNIFFPADGSQPTTANAVNYALANIDNRENSPITEWYMMMFGVIPFQNAGAPGPNDYIKAGWSAPNTGSTINTQRIISFYENVNTVIVNDPNIPGAQISRLDLFVREFRKIASTSVGRVLLYRILIEIRRHNPGENVGCTENDRYFTDTTITRRAVDRCRHISIMYMPTFGFDDTIGAIFFYENPNNIGGLTPLIFSVIGKSENDYTHIVQSPIRLDVVIFHEISHWFHHLRNPKRYYDEINADNVKGFHSHLPVHQYYWNGINMARTNQNYANIWYAGNHGHLDFEEMRNLLGMPYDCQQSLNGDDLCENLYRINQGLPLRFGYSGIMFYEDKKVTDRVIGVCISNHIVYVTGRTNSVDFLYNHGVNCFGTSRVRP